MALPSGLGAAERRIVLYTAAAHALVHSLEWTYSALLVDIGHQYGAGFSLLGALGWRRRFSGSGGRWHARGWELATLRPRSKIGMELGGKWCYINSPSIV